MAHVPMLYALAYRRERLAPLAAVLLWLAGTAGCTARSVWIVGSQPMAIDQECAGGDLPCPPFTLDQTFANNGVFVLDVGGVDNLAWNQGLALQPDGRIVLGGMSGSATNSNFAAVRLLDNGALDPTFGIGGIAEVDLGYAYEECQAVRLQADAKIVLVGHVLVSPTSEWRTGMARLLADGSPDPAFGTGGWRVIDVLASDLANGLVLLSDGRLRLCGQGWAAQPGPSDLQIYGLAADGSIETSFGTNGVLSIDFFGFDEFGGACQPGGGDSLLVPGTSYNNGSTSFAAVLARLRPDGSFDPAFDDGSTGMPGRATLDLAGRDESCAAVVRQTDGAIICAGSSTAAGAADSLLIRISAAGALDSSFGTGGLAGGDLGGDDLFKAVALLPDGRIAAAGHRTNAAGNQDFSLAVFTSGGGLDTSVGAAGVFTFDITPGYDDEARSLAVDTQGRLVISGGTSDGSSTNFAVLRLAL